MLGWCGAGVVALVWRWCGAGVALRPRASALAPIERLGCSIVCSIVCSIEFARSSGASTEDELSMMWRRWCDAYARPVWRWCDAGVTLV